MKRRVVINGRFLSQAVTGVQRYAREVTRALDDMAADNDPIVRGWEFELAVPPDARIDLALRHIRVRVAGSLLRGQAWEQLALPFAAGADTLLNFASTGPLAVRRQLVVIHDASMWAVPAAFTPVFRGWYRLLLPALGRSSRWIGTVSEFSRGELIKHVGVPAEKIIVTLAGAGHASAVPADHAALSRFGLPEAPFVLAVSSDAPHKQFAVVEAALEHPSCAHLGFVIVGGDGGRTLAAGPRRPGGRARRVGRVTDGELRALYERALCLAFPSMYEGFGLPPVEAMAVGCPVVVSTAGALPEVCGDAALYCAPSDSTGLAAQIASLAADPGMRRDLVKRGLRRARLFTWRHTAQAIVRALDPGRHGGGRVSEASAA